MVGIYLCCFHIIVLKYALQTLDAEKGGKMTTDEYGLMMSNFNWTILRLMMLLLAFLQLPVPSVIAQRGFLSIDCGGNRSHTDPETGITWIPDYNYIQQNVGYSAETITGTSNFGSTLGTLRYFPKTLNKSCYQLPVIPNVTYLVRMSFFYGNYDGKNEIPIFQTSVETAGTLWQFGLVMNGPKYFEEIVRSSNDRIYICLIRTSNDSDPFISSIELRALLPGMYKDVRPGTALNRVDRIDFGAKSSNPIRYPKDPFDRLWFSDDLLIRSAPNIYHKSNSEVPISTQSTAPDRPPPAVMQTALVVSTAAPYLGLPLNGEPFLYSNLSSSIEVLILCYFAETQVRNKSESRTFNIMINNITRATISVPSRGPNVSAIEIPIRLEANPTARPFVTLSIAKESIRGPMINALEHYDIVRTELQTSLEDVGALAPIGRTFDMKEWIADPCYIVEWNGITCDRSSSAVRVSQLDLSGKNLNGRIPSSIGRLTALTSLSLDKNHLEGDLPDLSNLIKLERLHLQNNNFSGDLPLWLFELKNLKELSLDNNNLTGTLPDLSNVTELEILHLQSNRLSGRLPDWLSRLNHLKELYLDHNNFNGTISPELLSKYPSLMLRIYPGNAQLKCGIKHILCNSTISQPNNQPNNQKVKIVLAVTTGAVLIITLALIIIFIVYRKKFWRKEHANKDKSRSVLGNLHEEDYSLVRVPNPSNCLAFTLDEMITATQNFSQKIGQGGFGSVFFGKLQDGKDVAVKVLSLFSKQGVVEFLNEVDLLSRVNHKNLVSLLGYCNESRELMLIYEHMPGGSLKDHLYGSAADLSNLDWKTRLKIALDAAQGLEYLQLNCTPKIIHRDVKAANILLDSNLTAKLSDFGLSRMTFNEGASHITTTVKGTAGYLDPEYFSTHMLTEKSDVYSFGVVLLEIICGRQPIDGNLSEDQINLIRWVTPYVEADEDPGKLAEIVDKRLNSDYDMKSVSHIAKLAIRCVENDPSLRPIISEIVAEIKEAIRFQPNIAAAFVSEEIEREFEDLQSSPVCSSSNLDSSMPKEFDSSGSSHSFFRK